MCLCLQRLLQLSAADLYQLVDRKLDADLLLDAIQELRAREVSISMLLDWNSDIVRTTKSFLTRGSQLAHTTPI